MIVRVLVVDDHPVVRSGLRALLAGRQGLDVVGEAASGEEALELAATLSPDVVLCDLRLGLGMDGVAVTGALRAREDGPAVLILTTYDHDTDIVRAVEAGAAGYLLKDAGTDQIVEAVHAAARGDLLLAADLTARVVETMRRGARPRLSEREREVLALVSQGLTNKAVARQLLLSQATVKTHLLHIFTKLGADSRTGAVTRARELGALD